ncbi:hypothetical protein D3C85_481720 [compost metagenome]
MTGASGQGAGGEPRSALAIGFGTGITAGALLSYPQLEQRVVAELLPAAVRAAPLFRATSMRPPRPMATGATARRGPGTNAK